MRSRSRQFVTVAVMTGVFVTFAGPVAHALPEPLSAVSCMTHSASEIPHLIAALHGQNGHSSGPDALGCFNPK
jgi:hypothetical protein